MERIVIEYSGHRYTIQNLDGNGQQTIQFVQREPRHRAREGIVLQDLFRICIDRLRVLDAERPNPMNLESIKDLQVIIARQEARALVEAVKADKLKHIEFLPTDANGHLIWDKD